MGGVPALGQEDARAVKDREHFGGIGDGRKFPAELLLAVGVDAPAVLFEVHALERLAALGKIEFVLAEADDVLFDGIGDLHSRVLAAVGDKEGVFIAECSLAGSLDADDIFAQELHADAAKNDLFHFITP